MSRFDDRYVAVAARYEAALNEQLILDFDRIVFESLRLVQSNAVVRDLLAARFPWLVVDEYQDLGGPLHQIVLTLSNAAGIKVFAVGDEDQTVFEFSGADSRYLNELAATDGYRTIRLRFNYRSGSRIMAASEAALALDAPRGYLPDPERRDDGEVFIQTVAGGLTDQISFLTETILPTVQGLGVPLHEVVVLYPGKGALLTRIQEGLESANVPYLAEREGLFSRTPFVRWLQKCANWAVGARSHEEILFEELLAEYAVILQNAGTRDSGPIDLETRRRLFTSLERAYNEEYLLADWLDELQQSLDLRSVLAASPAHLEDLEDFDTLVNGCLVGQALAETSVGEFARDGRTRDRLVLTTYHSSKGRQFDVVVLPGLQEGIMPSRRINRRSGTLDAIPEAALSAQRRRFYVGLSRAKRMAFLLSSNPARDTAFAIPLVPSRFIAEVQTRLAQG